jgi:hypothetical protein
MPTDIKKSASGPQPETPALEAKTRLNIQNYYTPYLKKSPDATLREQRALWWLERDFLLIPIQPNSKKIVRGFGMHQDKIGNPERVHRWFGPKTLANLAVCSTSTGLILDFDDPDLYKFWASKFPAESRTYTEQTPRGGYHVFAHVWSELRKGFMPIKGVELKRVVLVYPSRVDNRPYGCGAGEILDLDATLVLSPLSQAPVKPPEQRIGIRDPRRLGRIKSAFSCLELLKVKDSGPAHRFISVPCPFHDDKEPSFWIDTGRNLWGCHACGVHGDVINLYARLKGITDIRVAIREMGEKL